MYIFWCNVRELFCLVDVDAFEVSWMSFENALGKQDLMSMPLGGIKETPNQLYLV